MIKDSQRRKTTMALDSMVKIRNKLHHDVGGSITNTPVAVSRQETQDKQKYKGK
jgi:hypothetical protein